jgi:hypothetical protein
MIARSGECRLTVFCEKWRFCNKKSCHPERNSSRAKRATNAVEGPL